MLLLKELNACYDLVGPEARCEECQGARHLPNIEYPEAFNRMLLAWVKG